jgi:nicotinamidase-related amidase
MSINEALVVVDMQEDFLGMAGDAFQDDESADERDVMAAVGKLMRGVLREVEAAKRKQLPIVCLQYANQEDGFDDPKESWEYHATAAEIRKALKGYPRAFYVWKDNDDGSEETLDVLNGVMPRNMLDKSAFRGKRNKLRKFITDEHKMIDFTVVGVNADACVAATCCGLIDAGYKCRVPSDASMNVRDCTFADESSELDNIDGVRIIHQSKGWRPLSVA